MISHIFSRCAAVVIALGFTAASHALVIDFTDSEWSSAISGKSASLGDVTLSSDSRRLTFNAKDRKGCVKGKLQHGLKCDGDGIGIGDDEISKMQKLKVTFSTAVNILNVDFLDLFGGKHKRLGETASIMASGTVNDFHPSSRNGGVKGGFWSTGFQALGITELVFQTKNRFSNFSLARIEYDVASAEVSEPGSLVLLGLGLLGFAAMRRRQANI